ncbi:hypothetical protein [Alkalihalobacterium sp. APHAB7]|uniref:hypothetical protein n=1 Tax=Alkalihalobacterium sp. APHAB7 TaxID=3402081 RepID=UPI003AAB801B
MKILEKVITAILSGIVFSLGLAFLNGSMEYFLVYLMFSGTIFLTGGILFSLLADVILEKVKANKYLLSLVIYGIGGVIVNFFFYIGLYNEGFVGETLSMLLLGIIASLLFLHILLVTKKILKHLVG